MPIFDFQRCPIVYCPTSPDSDAEHEVAYTLRKRLSDTCHLLLAVAKEDELPSAPALCIGRITGLTPKKNEYVMGYLRNEILALAAGSAAAWDDLIEDLVSRIKENHLLPDTPVTFVCKDRSIGVRNGDLRVIYHNIFGYDRKPTINPQRRYAFEAMLYREYDADLLCLQEYDGGPRKYLAPRLLENGYEEVEVEREGFDKNCSPILYDKTRLALLDHGFYPFAYRSAVDERVCNNQNTKNITWAVFEHLQTKKRFVVLSMHYYYSPDASSDMTNRIESNKARNENAKEACRLITEHIRVKDGGIYRDLPVLLGGDLNCSAANRTLPSLVADCNGHIALDEMEDLGMKHLQKNSALFADDISAYCFYPTYDEELGYYDHCGDLSNTTFSKSIDHVYTYGVGLRGMTFDVLDGSFAKKTSDHCPILVDLNFE